MKISFNNTNFGQLVVGFNWTEKDSEKVLGHVDENDDDDGETEPRESKSAETSPKVRKTERFLSTVVPPQTVTKSRKISYKDETNKFRDHNLFSKKVPKNAEVVNIQVCKMLF